MHGSLGARRGGRRNQKGAARRPWRDARGKRGGRASEIPGASGTSGALRSFEERRG